MVLFELKVNSTVKALDKQGLVKFAFTPGRLKRKRDVSDIAVKVMYMYARGMSQRDISDIIEEYIWSELFHETLSSITDRVLETAEEWQNRPIKKFNMFVFVDLYE